jgi:prepilin-type N-terminal cleavage/methylation domain-containing protein
LKKAVTLLELLITVIILGILAALAIPNYYKTREHALGKTAVANLKLLDAAEEIYRLEYKAYYPSPAPGSVNALAEINNYLKLSLSDDNWDYTVTTTSDNAFTAIAERENEGGYLDCQYSINQGSPDGNPQPQDPSKCP